jgi:hypothetical protein
MFNYCCNAMPAALHNAWQEVDVTQFDKIFHQTSQPTATTNRRWFHDQGLFPFQEKSGFA